MKLLRQVASFAILACMLPSIANGECKVVLYKISGSATDKFGHPLTAPISFSWVEEYDGRTHTKTVRAKAGRYSIDLPFYAQAKAKLGVPVLGRALYSCDAQLASASYTYQSAPKIQQIGVVEIAGSETIANLPTRNPASSPIR